ncbi:hypothetical protein CJ010_24845 [Azoarcus sp. DD4]|uniref:hypothetical protein n=1 Tax=Azoarcus sp. DD4 TaxID=2027405 RepID=UPI001128C851|nr:hypothetical protein [Azoarcus sp. DD4]QDF99535.1 hypothetical protein CJ010_24845 [Azoarcus sp. DD4]
MNVQNLAYRLTLTALLSCTAATFAATAAAECKLQPNIKGDLRCVKVATVAAAETAICPHGPALKQACAPLAGGMASPQAADGRVAAAPIAAESR